VVGEAGVDRTVHAEIRRGTTTIGVQVRLVRDTPAPKTASAPLPGPQAGAPAAPVLGLEIAKLDANSRNRFKISAGVERGVVILAVLPSSPLKELDLHVGDTIVEVEQQQVTTPDELRRRLASLKRRGTAKALLLIAHPGGAMRFVRIPVG
jgi:serine protease Do